MAVQHREHERGVSLSSAPRTAPPVIRDATWFVRHWNNIRTTGHTHAHTHTHALQAIQCYLFIWHTNSKWMVLGRPSFWFQFKTINYIFFLSLVGWNFVVYFGGYMVIFCKEAQEFLWLEVSVPKGPWRRRNPLIMTFSYHVKWKLSSLIVILW